MYEVLGECSEGVVGVLWRCYGRVRGVLWEFIVVLGRFYVVVYGHYMGGTCVIHQNLRLIDIDDSPVVLVLKMILVKS